MERQNSCLVSAAAEPSLSELAAENDMEFLKKPVKPGKLRAMLEQLIKRGESEGFRSKTLRLIKAQ